MPRGVYDRSTAQRPKPQTRKPAALAPIWWEAEDDLTPYVQPRIKDEHKQKFALRVLREYIRWCDKKRDEEAALDATQVALDDFGVTRANVEANTILWRKRWPAPVAAKMPRGGEAALIK